MIATVTTRAQRVLVRFFRAASELQGAYKVKKKVSADSVYTGGWLWFHELINFANSIIQYSVGDQINVLAEAIYKSNETDTAGSSQTLPCSFRLVCRSRRPSSLWVQYAGNCRSNNPYRSRWVVPSPSLELPEAVPIQRRAVTTFAQMLLREKLKPDHENRVTFRRVKLVVNPATNEVP